MTTQLRSLMDEGADSYVPDGIARVAVEAARRRRRHRYAAAGAAGAVAAVVLGFVVVSQPLDVFDDEVVPASFAPIPAALLDADTLPTLTQAPMAAASMAYVVDGEVILVNAETGQASVVFGRQADLLSSSSGSDGPAEVVHGWDSAVLSPDGRKLLMSVPRAYGFEGPQGRLVYLLDVSTGDVTRLMNVTLVDDQGVAGGFIPQALAWSPSSDAFVCVCIAGQESGVETNVLYLADLFRGSFETVRGVPFQPHQVAWGSEGIAVQLEAPDGQWRLLDEDLNPLEDLPPVDLLALAVTTAEHALVRNFYPESVSDESPVASGPAWTIEIDDGSAPSLPGRPTFRGGTAVSVSAVAGGYAVVLRPRDAKPGEPPPPTELDVVLIDAGVNESSLTRLPRGTSGVSFAGSLVGG
jgi:hypothetical protein